MSFAVMRGTPNAGQRYLDGVLAQLVAETGREQDRYSLAKILFKCMRDNPHDTRQIEGNSGEIDSNAAALERSVRTALALRAAGLEPGDVVLVIGRNTLELTALYFGAMFAGVVLYVLHVGINAYEMKHYLKIAEPALVFTGSETLAHMEQALKESGLPTKVVLFGPTNNRSHRNFAEFTSGFDDQVKDFWPVDRDAEDAVLIFSTSGSTGLPKAAILNNRGLVAHIPSLWCNHDTFPKPTPMYMCTTNASWITHTIAMTSCTTFGIPVLTTSADLTSEHLRMLIMKYKPTFTFIPGHLGLALAADPALQKGDLSSIDTLIMAGCVIPEHLLDKVQHVLRSDARAMSVYGITEIQGCVTIPRPGAPKMAVGTVVNVLKFKIIDEKGSTLGPNQAGELCLKTDYCLFKGYVKNQEAFDELFTEDGWFKTGDKVYMNEHDDILFVDRIKFLIKYRNHHISPAEVEEVVTQVSGVHAAAVCGAAGGPAALVVPRPGYKITPQDIHDAVSSTLSDVKRLRGGVVFVPSLPLSANGKVERAKLKDMFEKNTEDEIHFDVNE